MKIVVLSGVSGTGKTHWRTTHEKAKTLPYVDMMDIYKDHPTVPRGATAVHTLWIVGVKPLLEAEERGIIIEGYFLPGSESRWALEWEIERARKMGYEIDVQYVFFWEPLEVIEERLVGQRMRGEIGDKEYTERWEMAQRCWKPKRS